MAASKLSNQDKKDLEKFSKYLVYKTIQIIVQSRLGEKMKTQSKPVSSGSDWFNLAIKDLPEIVTETKKIFNATSLTVGQHVCVEISLKTAEGDTMVLETWGITMNDHCDPSARVSYTVYNRMGLLLKSLFCLTRVTPAYRLSRKQGKDTLVVLYRIYMGEPQVLCLGEGFERSKVGSVPTPVGTITLSVAYRTKLLISPQQSMRDLSVDLKDDHFTSDGSPKKPIPRPRQSVHTKDIGHSPAEEIFYCESQDCCNTTFNTGSPDSGSQGFSIPNSPINKSSPKRPSIDKPPEETLVDLEQSSTLLKNQKYGVFAPHREPDKDTSEDSDDIPFISLLVDAKEAINGDVEEVNGEKAAGKAPDTPVGSVGSANSNKSDKSGGVSGPEDFVLVELKTPFAATDANTDLSQFYRDCQGAPNLAMFDSQMNFEQTLSSITDQLALFEGHAVDYEEFVNEMQLVEDE